MKAAIPLLAAFPLLGAALLTGCAPDPAETPDAAPPFAADPHAGRADDIHPTEGPHGGGLIELGDEEYHAELVHDEAAGSVTIYLLDSHGDAPAPVDAANVTIHLVRAGAREAFALPADPDAGDPEGRSSRFVSSDPELAGGLDAEGATAKFLVKIAGRAYAGEIAHDHAGH